MADRKKETLRPLDDKLTYLIRRTLALHNGGLVSESKLALAGLTGLAGWIQLIVLSSPSLSLNAVPDQVTAPSRLKGFSLKEGRLWFSWA